MKYVFDFDNTLVYTDRLNNTAYNTILEELGFKKIPFNTRITRTTIKQYYPQISEEMLLLIVTKKQDYAINHLELSEDNEYLIRKLKSFDSGDCLLWTSAEKKRVTALLSYFQLSDCFSSIYYSAKDNILHDVEEICSLLKCDFHSIYFFDDNKKIVDGLLSCGIKHVENVAKTNDITLDR